jgi:hypothetical protein|tara:strand:+ start:3757 stop:3939 length:183 start_codon:yes stop_codon:yes gene_type:complete
MARRQSKSAAGMNYWYALYGLVLLLLAWLLWSGTFSLEQAVAGVLALWGLKKLFMGGCHC